MIFRRRRTRIEIEHTAVKLQGGVLHSFVAPPAPAPAENALARVLQFPAAELSESKATPSALPTANPIAKETRS